MFKLQDMRGHKHLNFLVKIFFGIVIVSFVFFYGWNKSDRNSGEMTQKEFAKLRSDSLNPLHQWDYIDGKALGQAESSAVDAKLAAMPQYMAQVVQQQGNPRSLVTSDDVAREAANTILVERAANDLKVRVTADSVIEQLRAQPNMSNEALEQAAAQRGTDARGLIERFRKMDETGRVKALKGLVAHASLFELWQEYSLAHEKLTLQVAAYPATAFEKMVVVTDADLEKYLTDHKKDFFIPAQRRYAYIKQTKAELALQIKPTDKDLQAYYEKNQAQFMRKASSNVDEIFAPLTKDQASTVPLRALNAIQPQAAKEANWTSLTQQLNRQYAGVNFVHRQPTIEEGGEQSAAIQERIKTLTADKVSTPVLDSEGLHLLRVTKRTPAGVPPLAEIRAQVESDYKDKEAAKNLKVLVAKMEAEIQRFKADHQTTNTLRRLATGVGLKDELTTRVQATAYTIPGIGSLREDRDYLTSLQKDQLSDVIQTPSAEPDTVAVIQVVEETEGHDPKLVDIRDKVESALRKERAIELARASAEQSLNLLKGGADFAKALANAPKAPFVTPAVTRLDPVEGLGGPLIDFKKQTMRAATGSTGLSPYGNDKAKPDGFAIWKVQQLEPPSQDQFAKDRMQFEQDYLQVQRETIVREWLADQRRAADFTMVEK